MKNIKIYANPAVDKVIQPVEFKMPHNNSLEDHELVQINFVDKDGNIFRSSQMNVIRIIDEENGEPAWFEAYIGNPTKRK